MRTTNLESFFKLLYHIFKNCIFFFARLLSLYYCLIWIFHLIAIFSARVLFRFQFGLLLTFNNFVVVIQNFPFYLPYVMYNIYCISLEILGFLFFFQLFLLLSSVCLFVCRTETTSIQKRNNNGQQRWAKLARNGVKLYFVASLLCLTT